MLDDNNLGRAVSSLVTHLFENEQQRLKKTRLLLVQKNRELQGKPIDGFDWNGILFCNLGPGVGLSNALRGAPHKELHNELYDFVNDESTIQKDERQIHMALAVLLAPCRSMQDVRDALPNGLASVFEGTKNLRRSRPEAYTLQDNERALRQWARVREKIDFYLAGKLLY